MNPIQQELADAFVEILADFGVPVTVAGNTTTPDGDPLLAVMSQGEENISRADFDAGFSLDAEVRLKLLVSHLPEPLPGHLAEVSIDGKRYAVTETYRKPNHPVVTYRATIA